MKRIILTVGLQRNVEEGDIAAILLDMTKDVADRILEEQGDCQLLSECGELTDLLNLFANINGYQCAYFLRADVDPAGGTYNE